MPRPGAQRHQRAAFEGAAGGLDADAIGDLQILRLILQPGGQAIAQGGHGFAQAFEAAGEGLGRLGQRVGHREQVAFGIVEAGIAQGLRAGEHLFAHRAQEGFGRVGGLVRAGCGGAGQAGGPAGAGQGARGGEPGIEEGAELRHARRSAPRCGGAGRARGSGRPRRRAASGAARPSRRRSGRRRRRCRRRRTGGGPRRRPARSGLPSSPRRRARPGSSPARGWRSRYRRRAARRMACSMKQAW